MLSAVFAPGRIEKLRIAARNFLIFGGGAAVLLYPEWAYPNLQKVAARGEDVAKQAGKNVPWLQGR